MNASAKAANVTECSVRIELGTPEAVTFVAERTWTFSGGKFVEELSVTTEGRDFRRDSAEERLADLLPRELVPFFFFDGEELQFSRQPLAPTLRSGTPCAGRWTKPPNKPPPRRD
ncbi:MAG: hypothetical protein H7840_04180 [Alphaproteobacteria bacterium]